jgi:hypothetical protein
VRVWPLSVMLDGAMSTDENRPQIRRRRRIVRADLPAGPARDLRDVLYDLHLRAGTPTLDAIADRIRDDETLPGVPGRDTISRIISGRDRPASLEDAVSIAITLAYLAAEDPIVSAPCGSPLTLRHRGWAGRSASATRSSWRSTERSHCPVSHPRRRRYRPTHQGRTTSGSTTPPRP